MSESSSPEQQLPPHGPCFICGPEHSAGTRLDRYVAEGRIHSTPCFTESHQGLRDHAHGGAAAAVSNEAMGTPATRPVASPA